MDQAEAHAVMEKVMTALLPIYRIIREDGENPGVWLAGFDTALRVARQQPELARRILEALDVDVPVKAGFSFARNDLDDDATRHILEAFESAT